METEARALVAAPRGKKISRNVPFSPILVVADWSISVFLSVYQHPCPDGGRGVQGGNGGQPPPVSAPPYEDQPAASLGRGVLPRRHVSLRLHHRGLHRGPRQPQPNHLHLEPQPHNAHGKLSKQMSAVLFVSFTSFKSDKAQVIFAVNY